MADKLNGKTVRSEMRSLAVELKRKGGKVFICYPDAEGEGNCKNCDGHGHFILQRIADGPYATPPTPFAEGTGRSGEGKAIRTLVYLDDAWFRVNNLTFDCPICQGTGNQVKPPAPPPPNKAAWDKVFGTAKKMGAKKTQDQRIRQGQL